MRLGRFEQDDLISVLAHEATARPGQHTSSLNVPRLQAGTRSGDGLGSDGSRRCTTYVVRPL